VGPLAQTVLLLIFAKLKEPMENALCALAFQPMTMSRLHAVQAHSMIYVAIVCTSSECAVLRWFLKTLTTHPPIYRHMTYTHIVLVMYTRYTLQYMGARSPHGTWGRCGRGSLIVYIIKKNQASEEQC
jgi:hypothetical protein